jgi:hypothetical protein
MVERLRAKPGGDAVPVTIGDFTDVPVAGPYDVVLLAFNTLLNLTTDDAQVRCLTRCAAIAPVVVVETFVPAEVGPSSGLDVRHVGSDELRLSAYEVVDGVVTGSFVSITVSGIRLRPWSVRLATPSAIDALAATAGLRVVERWAGWRGEPFDATCDRCVTVYGRR